MNQIAQREVEPCEDRRSILRGHEGWQIRGEEYVAVDVRLSDGQRWLFWPSDLEEIASPKLSLGRSLLSGESRS